ncbi:MAG: Sec-independent protein translocase protein TatB [Arenicella sp.]
MFDIGFFELALIGVVLLIVMGPEKLPEVARQGAFFVRKIRGWVTDIRSEMDMKDDGGLSSLREATREIADLKASLAQMGQDVMTEVDDVSGSVKDAVAGVEDNMSELDPESYFQQLISDDVEVSPIDDVVAGKPEGDVDKPTQDKPKKVAKKSVTTTKAKAKTATKKTTAKKAATKKKSQKTTATRKKATSKKSPAAKKANS